MHTDGHGCQKFSKQDSVTRVMIIKLGLESVCIGVQPWFLTPILILNRRF